MIVEQRDYHVYTGELPDLVRIYAAAHEARSGWQRFHARIQPLIHTQQNRILVPTSFSPIA